MDIRELRIGNFVTWSDDNDILSVLTITGITSPDTVWIDWEWNDGTKDSTDSGIDDINPIPITPEWLERLGFEKMPPKNHWEEYWDKGILRLYITDGKISPIAVIHSKKPKYVHQLQNLFYALTGEELTIK